MGRLRTNGGPTLALVGELDVPEVVETAATYAREILSASGLQRPFRFVHQNQARRRLG